MLELLPFMLFLIYTRRWCLTKRLSFSFFLYFHDFLISYLLIREVREERIYHWLVNFVFSLFSFFKQKRCPSCRWCFATGGTTSIVQCRDWWINILEVASIAMISYQDYRRWALLLGHVRYLAILHIIVLGEVSSDKIQEVPVPSVVTRIDLRSVDCKFDIFFHAFAEVFFGMLITHIFLFAIKPSITTILWNLITTTLTRLF